MNNKEINRIYRRIVEDDAIELDIHDKTADMMFHIAYALVDGVEYSMLWTKEEGIFKYTIEKEEANNVS